MDNISSNTIDDLISNRKYFAQITQEFLKTISLERIPLFSSIEIETMNRCNGKCTFCPVNHDIDPRKFSRMSEPLFQKIIDELKTLNYRGRLALYSNNEPFLDVRIEDFARYARSALPRAYIYIYTNGTVLNKTRLERILPSLDYMIIDNYDDNGIITDSIRQLIESCKSNTEFSKKVKISMRKQNEVLFSRGGNAPNKKIVQPLQMSCILPFKQIIIRPDGKLSLCSNDALGKYTLGDITTHSLVECWTSMEYMSVRKKIMLGRSECELCRACDSLYNPADY